MVTATRVRRHWVQGIRDAVPIVAGYVPAAMAFGVAARQAGLSVAEAVLMSVMVYAGASQFALAGMFGAGVPAVAAATTSLVLNLRHVLYGPALAPLLPRLSRRAAAAAAFGLTDEAFALASGVLPGTDAHATWLFGLEATAYASWVLGTWLGAVGGQAAATLLPSLAPALGFALPALFVALLVSLLVAPRASPTAASGEAPPEGTTSPDPETLSSALAGAIVALAAALLGWSRWGILAAGVLGPLVGLTVGRSR